MSLPLREMWIAMGAKIQRGKIALIRKKAVMAKTPTRLLSVRGIMWILATAAMATLIFVDTLIGMWVVKAWESMGLKIWMFCAADAKCDDIFEDLSALVQVLMAYAVLGVSFCAIKNGIIAASNASAIASEKAEAAQKRLAAENRAKRDARALEELLPEKHEARKRAKRL